ncbi:CCD32 protein, partial [Anseranas semipalmata]|nr:CCD32 protein [Anseranas semipalmata]
MRMIESVDSAVTRSSEDLWAEICSCLPHPDHKDASDAFTDSFMDLYAGGGSQDDASGGSSQTNLKPWAPLSDSEVYLASLGWENVLQILSRASDSVNASTLVETRSTA